MPILKRKLKLDISCFFLLTKTENRRKTEKASFCLFRKVTTWAFHTIHTEDLKYNPTILNSLSRISKCNIIQLSIFILKQNTSVQHDFIKISLYQFLCEFSLLQWLFKYSISFLGLQKAVRFPVKFSFYKIENIWSLLFIFSFSGQHPSLHKFPVIGFLLLTWQMVSESWTAPTS